MIRPRTQVLRGNPLRLGQLDLSNDLLYDIPEGRRQSLIDEVVINCKRLTHLRLGFFRPYSELLEGGAISDGGESCNDVSTWHHRSPRRSHYSIKEEILIEPKLIANNLHDIRSLDIGMCVRLIRNMDGPSIQGYLLNLERLTVPDVYHFYHESDESILFLAQSSKKLKILDITGCDFGMLALASLKTEVLESLRTWGHFPAASILSRWSCTLKYLTLAYVGSHRAIDACRHPEQEKVDNCLRCLAVSNGMSKLEHLDIQSTDCTLEPLKLLVSRCERLTFLDTSDCQELPAELRRRFYSRADILRHFS